MQSIPIVNGAMFALLPPGGELGTHRDPFAGSLRYHLGLVTPNSDDCHIFVDGETYYWRDGEAVMFDETYIHWAENKTDVDARDPVLRRRAAADQPHHGEDQPLVRGDGDPREPDRERRRATRSAC